MNMMGVEFSQRHWEFFKKGFESNYSASSEILKKNITVKCRLSDRNFFLTLKDVPDSRNGYKELQMGIE